MSDRSRGDSERISSLWQDAWDAMHSGGQVHLTARWIFRLRLRNCHVMKEHFDSWQQSSHHHDCAPYVNVCQPVR